MGDHFEVLVTTIPGFFFKLDVIFYFVWQLKAIFLSHFYVEGTTEQTGSQEACRLEYSFYAK